MTWIALTCPQCGAALPRVALWRAVKCGSCGSLITRTESIVTRDSFRQALNRARAEAGVLDSISCGGARYHLAERLGVGELSQVYLGRRVGAPPLLATIKLSSAPAAAAHYSREAAALGELQALDAEGSGAYFTRLLPEVIARGAVEGSDGKQALILTHPIGFWGSLAALNDRFASGLDPRHVVWIWRRILEILNFIHRHDWVHGDIRPEHALVHPQNHAVRLIGWAAARKGADNKEKAADLSRTARVAEVLVSGADTPKGLAQLIKRAGSDDDFCRAQSARGLDLLLQAEAKAAFGPPTFVPLTI